VPSGGLKEKVQFLLELLNGWWTLWAGVGRSGRQGEEISCSILSNLLKKNQAMTESGRGILF